MGGTGATMNDRISDEMAWLMFASGCLADPAISDAESAAEFADKMLRHFRSRYPLPPLNPRLGGDFGPVRRKGRVLPVEGRRL